MTSWHVVQVAPPHYRLRMDVYESSGNMQEEEMEMEELTFIVVELRVTGRLSTGYMRINVCLDGVVSEESTPVIEVRNVLNEMGVTMSTHVFIIALLFEFIQRNAMFSALVVMNLEETDIPGRRQVTNVNHESGVVDDDDEIVYQVQEQRMILRETMSDDDELELESVGEFDAVASESMEVDVNARVKTRPASEAAIAGLEKVHRREGELDSCVICDEDGDEDLARMPCKHVFHDKCLVAWLRISGSCPLCRFQLP